MLGCIVAWFLSVLEIKIASILAVLINLEVWVINQVIWDYYRFNLIILGPFFGLDSVLRFSLTCSFWRFFIFKFSCYWIRVILSGECSILSLHIWNTLHGYGVLGSQIDIEMLLGFINVNVFVFFSIHNKQCLYWCVSLY